MDRTGYRQARLRKRRRRRRLLRRCCGMTAAVLLCAGFLGLVGMELSREEKNPFGSFGGAGRIESGGEDKSENGANKGEESESEKNKDRENKIGKGSLKLNGLYSAHAALLDLSTGELMAEKDGDESIYPASLTKIMTAMLLVERAEDLSETTVLQEDLFGPLQLRGASMAGFLPGEEVSLEDLLYGMLLPSGAECSTAAARWVSGSEEAFAELMNQRAQELGMAHTHFVNATGLHEQEHCSPAEDLARLLAQALQYDAFRTAFITSRYTAGATAAHPDGVTLHSTMFESMRAAGLEDDRILGGKTGYTKEAGLCLASLLCVDGREYVLVTAGAQGNHQTEPYHVMDAAAVCEKIAARGN